MNFKNYIEEHPLTALIGVIACSCSITIGVLTYFHIQNVRQLEFELTRSNSEEIDKLKTALKLSNEQCGGLQSAIDTEKSKLSLLSEQLKDRDQRLKKREAEFKQLANQELQQGKHLDLLMNLSNYLTAKTADPSSPYASEKETAKERLVEQVREWWNSRDDLRTNYEIEFQRPNPDPSVVSIIRFPNQHEVAVPSEIKKLAVGQ